MISTTWMTAPAGVLGQGGADVRPAGGVLAAPAPSLIAARLRVGIEQIGTTSGFLPSGGPLS